MTRPLPADVSLDYPALACGIARDEGIMAAYIPVAEAMPEEYEYRDGKRWFNVYAIDGMVLDMLPEYEYDLKPVKWWMVREAARYLKLNYPEPILTCAAEDFRVSCLPDVPKQEGRVLAFRQYGRGPWIRLDDYLKTRQDERTGHAEGTGSEPPAESAG